VGNYEEKRPMEARQYEEELLAEIRQLPAEQVREVLDFAAFLRQRLACQADLLQVKRENAANHMALRRQRIGPVDVKAADLVEEGRVARLAEILKEGQGR
jgi:hypothetical protein